MSDKAKVPNPNEIIVRGARLSFPQLFAPKAIGDGKPRYTANLLLDPTIPEQKAQIVAVKTMVERITKEGMKKEIKLPRDKTCLRKDDEPRYEGYEGMWYITAARPATGNGGGPPLVVDQKREKLKADSLIPYAGCYVNAKIRLYYQDYDGVKRVNASLEVVQFVRHGEPFGAGAASADDMPEEVVEEEDTLDDSGADDDDL